MVSPNVQVVSQSDIAPGVWDNVAPPQARGPKLLHDWARCTAQAYSRNGALKVIVVGPLSRPDALVPLSVAPEGLHRHSFIANDDGGLPIPCRDATALPDIAAGLVRLRMPVDLGYYPADAPLIGEIERAARGRAKVVLRPQEIPAAPWLDLDPSWQDPDQHLKRNMKQSIRRNERRLRETGELRIDFHEPAEHEVDALLDTAVEVEAKSWKDRTGTALVHDTRQRDFFRLYAKTAARAGRLHITLVSLDGQPVAMYIGEIYNNVFWGYKTGFDEAFAKFGPGMLIHYHLISHLAGRGVSRFEFQGQLIDYKRRWTDKAVETVALRIYPFTPRGGVAAGYDWVRQRQKRKEAKKEAAARAAASPATARAGAAKPVG